MKGLLFLFIIVFSFASVSARDIYDKEIPSNFKKECFEFFTSFDFKDVQDGKNIAYINKGGTAAIRDGYLIPLIPYKEEGEKVSYTSDLVGDVNFLSDDNQLTGLEIDTDDTKIINLEFNEILPKGGFEMNFKHSAKGYVPKVFISEDGIRFSPVSFNQLSDFSVKSLKIVYSPRGYESCDDEGAECLREVINISELSFSKIKNAFLIQVKGGGIVDFYSNYSCDDSINLQTITVPFPITQTTPKVDILLTKNTEFNPNIEKDYDADGIDNTKDNCQNDYNPTQLDSDADGVGDVCSDIDVDGVVGHLDNCPTIANSDQLDINNNGVGDICEFDKDEDGIYDSIDNCITTVNPFQLDSDNDGIGNKCDNCELHNPDQKDVNGNGIGDSCDRVNERLALNDDDVDGIINGQDNCPLIKNSDQTDEDGDSVGDICDNCKSYKNNNQYDYNKNGIGDICEDSDGDGIEGIEDNCLNTPNSNQKDSDNDGVGDLCEDDDRDGILFADDNCPFAYNPFQKDTDSDTIGDICDENDDREIESNKNILVTFLIVISLVFIIAIFIMTNKLSNRNKYKYSDNFTVKPVGKNKKAEVSVKSYSEESKEKYSNQKNNKKSNNKKSKSSNQSEKTPNDTKEIPNEDTETSNKTIGTNNESTKK